MNVGSTSPHIWICKWLQNSDCRMPSILDRNSTNKFKERDKMVKFGTFMRRSAYFVGHYQRLVDKLSPRRRKWSTGNTGDGAQLLLATDVLSMATKSRHLDQYFRRQGQKEQILDASGITSSSEDLLWTNTVREGLLRSASAARMSMILWYCTPLKWRENHIQLTPKIFLPIEEETHPFRDEADTGERGM